MQVLYIVASMGALDYLHDAWFYWTHRLLHARLLYKHVHSVHHRCLFSSAHPLAGMRMDPCYACLHPLCMHAAAEGMLALAGNMLLCCRQQSPARAKVA